jgi:hypothetical protein
MEFRVITIETSRGRNINMMHQIRRIGFALIAVLAIVGPASQALVAEAVAAPAERFEITSIKKVRPTLVDTIAALQARDVARAKAAFEAYDSAWNGIEVYVNVRSRPMYQVLEHEFQARIGKGLETPSPDINALLADAQAMLAKFDETVTMIAAMPPLNSFYDEVARLRIVRAHLREVLPALKANDVAKARKSFQAFDDNWDSIEDLIKARSADSYVAIEKAMIDIEKALEPTPPDVSKVTALVNEIMRLYNAALAEIVKDARAKG